ncbi:beta-glucosidase [Bacteroides sp. 519]|uniref:beta-glucosidase family protein n=1 Tax=Bacteroides sp. 519 TaxID=2302937 RepID=UPI0013CFD9F5|nr:glycoside hydrolase family 3 C-terminal domain-containing protein [Bacteroides sp. 519]NDV58045.1 hypothetical protein [Bacteroides sp. 519]
MISFNVSKKLCASVFLCFIFFFSCSQPKPVKLGTSSVERVVVTMTLEEKARLLTNQAIPRLGIPEITFADTLSPDFPTAALLASTWNAELTEEVGKAMGSQALKHKVDILLTPAMNIRRNPLCGYGYSEDPLLSGKMAVAMVNGIQLNGVGASLKNFVVDGPINILTPRALREIYLKGFEIAVTESSPLVIMTSCNYMNGVYVPESTGLLRTVLRNEWGFKGIDLTMPDCDKQHEDIVTAVNAGTLKITDVNRRVTNMLNVILETPRFKANGYTDNSGLNAFQQATTEGMVLLENKNNALPLAPEITKVAVYGNYTESFVQGLVEAGYSVTKETPNANALVVIEPNGFELSTEQLKTIQTVCRTYQSAKKKVIVVLNADGIVETSSWKNLPDGILLTWYNKRHTQQVGNTVGNIIGGKANPSGKLPISFPHKYIDIPVSIRDAENTIYTEDIYVGYRYFDTFRKPVSYPFGFGLSYTTFKYSNITVEMDKTDYIVTLTVTNTGKTPGKEAVQLYTSSPINSEFPKPLKELKSFAKTGILAPGGSETLTLKINQMDLASFDETTGSWVVERGNYKFLIGASSQDIKEMVPVEIPESIVKQVNNVLLPQSRVISIYD